MESFAARIPLTDIHICTRLDSDQSTVNLIGDAIDLLPVDA
jgi:hypothetical protein